MRAGWVQNPRANGVGREMWVLKTCSRRPDGSATWMWAQMRACFRSRKRSTWWCVMWWGESTLCDSIRSRRVFTRMARPWVVMLSRRMRLAWALK